MVPSRGGGLGLTFRGPPLGMGVPPPLAARRTVKPMPEIAAGSVPAKLQDVLRGVDVVRYFFHPAFAEYGIVFDKPAKDESVCTPVVAHA